MVHNTFKSMGRVLCVVIKNAYKFNQINLYRTFFPAFSANSQLIFMKFSKNYFRVTRRLYHEIFIKKLCVAKNFDHLACNAIQG